MSSVRLSGSRRSWARGDATAEYLRCSHGLDGRRYIQYQSAPLECWQYHLTTSCDRWSIKAPFQVTGPILLRCKSRKTKVCKTCLHPTTSHPSAGLCGTLESTAIRLSQGLVTDSGVVGVGRRVMGGGEELCVFKDSRVSLIIRPMGIPPQILASFDVHGVMHVLANSFA